MSVSIAEQIKAIKEARRIVEHDKRRVEKTDTEMYLDLYAQGAALDEAVNTLNRLQELGNAVTFLQSVIDSE